MRVLFIGNSHTFFNDMPELFARFFETQGQEKPDVTMLAYSGRYLDWHVKEYFSIRFNIIHGHYDYCIIQQGAHPFAEEESTMKFGTRIIELCKSVGTTPVITMTWAEKRFPENQQKMIDTFTKLTDATGALLSPVGLIWQRIQKEHPEIELYFKDGEHASIYGDYLIAATHYALINHTTIALPPIGLDFLNGHTIDMNDLHLEEDPKKVQIELDPALTGIINDTVNAVLNY